MRVEIEKNAIIVNVRYPFPMKGFSLRWYQKMFTNEALLNALKTSLFIALCGTILALIIGTMGALAMKKYNFKLH